MRNVYIYIYIYIYMEREREREIYIYIYIYIYIHTGIVFITSNTNMMNNFVQFVPWTGLGRLRQQPAATRFTSTSRTSVFRMGRPPQGHPSE